MFNLRERERAEEAIDKGEVDIDGVTYIVEKSPSGTCDNCDLYKVEEKKVRCPSLAMKICTMGGYILKEI